ncbi:unnamed protein product [Periconia digitata]|uniref:Rhodopsin domain-containing protein n=1 Tax=Periconia digitata TaxID=1303443 RepID=A0A9W4UF43_9PLEO|nr:unnamed protein product [Periconia digitata]
MAEAEVQRLLKKLATNYHDLTPQDHAILSHVPAEQPPPGARSNFENPVSLNMSIEVVTSILLFFVLVFVAIRCHVKFGLKRRLTWDDATLLMAVMCTMVHIGATLWGVEKGKIGIHSWDINILTYYTMDYRVTSFIDLALAPITFAFLKASFFILYLQLFRTLKWILIFSWIGLILALCVYLTFAILFINFAVPRPGEHFDTRIHHGSVAQCIALSTFGFLLDLLILVLPIIAVTNLRMPKRRKFGAALVFLSGSLACVCSALSLYYRGFLLHVSDANWNIAVVDLVFLVEAMIGIICACTPSAAYWFRHAPLAQAIRERLSSHQSFSPATQHTSQLSSRVWPARKAEARGKSLARQNDRYVNLDEAPLSMVESHIERPAMVHYTPHGGSVEDIEALPPIIYRKQKFLF